MASFFYEHLTFSNQIFALSRSCYSHIRQLHPSYLDLKTATTMATPIAHSMLDYCNWPDLRECQL